MSPVVDKEQPSFNQIITSDNYLSDLDNKLKQINSKPTDNIVVDKKESEQKPTEVNGEINKTAVVEGNASSNSNTTAAPQVRVY